MRITLESISTCVQYPHVFGALSEFERNLIKERTRACLEAARGHQGGRPEKLSDEQ
ncbi:TPA: transposase, partial [Legionella pneumophila]|nr:transposase [Legionella pneumophila]